ncbi:CBS domain-containing protein [Cupriavidus basilensis]
MALGDAIAVALMKKRDFKPVDFARLHPGGSLGRMLLAKVEDEMHKLVPTAPPHATLDDVIVSMTQGRLGLVVVTEQGVLRGIFTDGDLRRALLAGNDALERPVSDFMTANPVMVSPGMALGAAQALMQEHGISSLVVVDDAGGVRGAGFAFVALMSGGLRNARNAFFPIGFPVRRTSRWCCAKPSTRLSMSAQVGSG